MPKGTPLPVVDLQADWWRVTCEYCAWYEDDVATRPLAVELGQAHARAVHPDEWAFRVQGLKYRRKPT